MGGPTWFRLGDRDLGLHLERTRRLRAGQALSQVTYEFCKSWGIHPRVLPMSDDSVPTSVYTEEGELTFQEYFVRRQCHPRVTGFHFTGVEQAHPAPGVLDSLNQADLAVICPSNPWVSIGPILAIPKIRTSLERSDLPVIAVSPIIAGQAIKGPAAKMYSELGIEPSAFSVARQYAGLLDGFILDRVDRDQVQFIEELGARTLVTDTLMKTPEDRRRLASEILSFAQDLVERS